MGTGMRRRTTAAPSRSASRSTSAFVLVEATFGFLSGSMALVADAGHNLSDVLSLVLAWGASVLARRAAIGALHLRLQESTILAALANAGLLLVAIGGDRCSRRCDRHGRARRRSKGGR